MSIIDISSTPNLFASNHDLSGFASVSEVKNESASFHDGKQSTVEKMDRETKLIIDISSTSSSVASNHDLSSPSLPQRIKE